MWHGAGAACSPVPGGGPSWQAGIRSSRIYRCILLTSWSSAWEQHVCSCPRGTCVHSHHAEHPACRSSKPAMARSSLLCSISVCVESLQGKCKIELGRYVLVYIFVSEPMSAGVRTHTQPCHPRMCTHTLCPTCARTHTHTLCPTGDFCTASAISCSTRDLSLPETS